MLKNSEKILTLGNLFLEAPSLPASPPPSFPPLPSFLLSVIFFIPLVPEKLTLKVASAAVEIMDPAVKVRSSPLRASVSLCVANGRKGLTNSLQLSL